MSSQRSQVHEFSEQVLRRALSNSRFTELDAAEHRGIAYLSGYLSAIGAKTTVIEPKYVDGDYLDDFATYYVKCFQPYERYCTRVHFFSSDFDERTFTDLVVNNLPEATATAICSSYLGFVVVRPLPRAVIGRTVLATYASDGGRRNYTCTRQYNVNLYGVHLSVKSLAFQQQDTVLAACATVALWCCFHKTADLFGTPAPRPAAITRAATALIHRSRPIPSRGLNVQQICNAISHIGLEPEVVEVKKNTPLPSMLYGYLRMGLPVIAGVLVEDGMHAIALTGYSLKSQRVFKQEVANGETAIPMTGLRIDEFYAHDDQFGPFSRLQIKPSATNKSPITRMHHIYPVVFEGSWTESESGTPIPLYPEVLIVPVYNKIRITFLDCQAWLTRFHEIIPITLAAKQQLEWDLYLTTTNEYKAAIRAQQGDASVLRTLLMESQPRFIWRAILRNQDHALVEILFDATDISKSVPVFRIIWHNEAFRGRIMCLISNPNLQSIYTEKLTLPFWSMLKAPELIANDPPEDGGSDGTHMGLTTITLRDCGTVS